LVNQAQRAFDAWNVLVDCARNRRTISYGELAGAIGIHHRPIRFVLGLIQDHCLVEKLQPLTILVTDRKGGIGAGFSAYDLGRRKEGEEAVFGFPWQTIENPFTFAADGNRYDSLIVDLSNDPSTSGDVMRLVKSRGMAQVMFRDALLRCYEFSCAFTGTTFVEALEACHIVPWAMCEPEDRLDVRNGILLNSLHHSLFDNDWITIDLDHLIHFSDPEMTAEPYTAFDKQISVELHGKKMRLPKNLELAPGANFIQRHHDDRGWGLPELS
jgi:putative restriction endonuclease